MSTPTTTTPDERTKSALARFDSIWRTTLHVHPEEGQTYLEIRFWRTPPPQGDLERIAVELTADGWTYLHAERDALSYYEQWTRPTAGEREQALAEATEPEPLTPEDVDAFAWQREREAREEGRHAGPSRVNFKE